MPLASYSFSLPMDQCPIRSARTDAGNLGISAPFCFAHTVVQDLVAIRLPIKEKPPEGGSSFLLAVKPGRMKDINRQATG